MSDLELYDATRGVWKVGKRREKAKFAYCVYGTVIREVYSISAWVPAGSTMTGRDFSEKGYRLSERWEFVGRVALESARKRYVGKSVKTYFPKGVQNPIKYVKC
jgi:hypothetical protein